jgi:hypothetical protein
LKNIERHTVRISIAVELKALEQPRSDLANVLAADLTQNARLTRTLSNAVDEAIAKRRVKALGRSIVIEA